jgi:hypothetical protein
LEDSLLHVLLETSRCLTRSVEILLISQQFEEAFNYIANKGYARMMPEEEKDWIELMNVIHDSVKGGMKYNTGTLLMVMSRPVAMSSHIASAGSNSMMMMTGSGGAGELKPQHKGKTPSKDLRNP